MMLSVILVGDDDVDVERERGKLEVEREGNWVGDNQR